jgi:sulfatase maturation enzyme AslB (radical SAM superfamily)
VPKKLIIDIELTSSCNAGCSFCPRTKLKRSFPCLSSSYLQKLLLQIDGLAKCHPIIIGLAGIGEPLLSKEGFLLTLSSLSEFVNRQNISVVLITNNSMFDQELIENPLLGQIDSVIVSASGYTFSDYSDLYNFNWESTLKNIKSLRKKWPDLSLGVSAVDYKKIPLSENTIAHSCQENNIPYSVLVLHNRGGHLYQKDMRPQVDCGFFHRHIFVSSDGHYLACSHDLAQENILGSVWDSSLETIIEKKTSFLDPLPFSMCLYCDDFAA